ncbi:MAG TPA: DUF3299 domain-containing protein [Burkholderiaceae bacterium]
MTGLARRRLLSRCAGVLLSALVWPAAQADGPRQIAWSELVPQDGDSMKALRGVDLSTLQDDDPRANELLMKMREAADNAPPNPALAGSQIRIAGFIVPLEENGGEITEFLLVPYFGACIHTPPPPANQIIHVNAPPASKGWRSMDLVWITGTLRISRADTMMGVSGYQMRAETMTRATPASAK